MIYLDYAANTPADPAVLDAFCQTERRFIGNANAAHPAGQAARAEMARVTDSIASLLNVSPQEIIYTSGASESNNLAIKGIVQSGGQSGRHIITTPLEHASVAGALSALGRQGCAVDVVDVRRDGTVDVQHLRTLLRQDTALVCVCAVDSELGAVQPTYPRGVTPCDLGSLLPGELSGALRDGVTAFGRKLAAYRAPDAVLTGLETRTSSPVRLLRGKEDLQCTGLSGLYPCGEGAGYAGGIMTAAVDGVRCAAELMKNWAPAQ